MRPAARQRRLHVLDAPQPAPLAVGLVLVLLLAGCLHPQTPSTDGPDATAEYVYSWSTTNAIGVDGGARIEMHPPATQCTLRAEIAGWTSDPGIDALVLTIPPNHDEIDWVFSGEADPYVQYGEHDNYDWRRALAFGGVALGAGGNMTQGEVVFMLAKNLTSWTALDGQRVPAILIDARCDAPGLSVTYAREAMILHDRNMEDGTVAGVSDVSVARDARQARYLNGSVDLFASTASEAQTKNNIEATLTIDGPKARHSWAFGPHILYDHGPAGHYRVEVDRVAAPMVGCAQPSAPCGRDATWWGFIAGFEETDDPDAFFGLRDG